MNTIRAFFPKISTLCFLIAKKGRGFFLIEVFVAETH